MPVRKADGWTGGQYSLFRGVFGAYLFVHFAALLPWGAELFSRRGMLPEAVASPLVGLLPNLLALCDAPIVVTALLVSATGLSVLLAIGLHDRVAAVLLWYVWACLFGRNPLIANPSLPYVGWMLLAHAALPAAPYGAWAARGRADPGAGWRMPDAVFAAAWVIMALGYGYAGLTKLASPSWVDGSALAHVLENPLARPGSVRDALRALPPDALRLATWTALGLELGFAPLALSGRARPIIWSLMLATHLALVLVLDFADLSLGMVILHLFTFDPAWVAPRAAGVTETLFYDGGCGLCHAFVRFVVAEDRSARAFRFAPLGGGAFPDAIPARRQAALPDGLVVRTAGGSLLAGSEAVRHVLARLGGAWRLLALAMEAVPRAARDRAFAVAVRAGHHVLARPAEACPLLPPALRARFSA